MVRLAFWSLLFGNLIFLAWGESGAGGGDAIREPWRLQQQLRPQQLRLLSADEMARLHQRSCRRIEWLGEGARELRASLAAEPGWRVRLSQLPQPRYWVVIANVADAADAAARQGEMRALGFAAATAVQQKDRFFVSLGRFDDEALARDLLQELLVHKVADVNLLPGETAPPQFAIEARGPERELQSRLSQLLPGVASDSLRRCVDA